MMTKDMTIIQMSTFNPFVPLEVRLVFHGTFLRDFGPYGHYHHTDFLTEHP